MFHESNILVPGPQVPLVSSNVPRSLAQCQNVCCLLQVLNSVQIVKRCTSMIAASYMRACRVRVCVSYLRAPATAQGPCPSLPGKVLGLKQGPRLVRSDPSQLPLHGEGPYRDSHDHLWLTTASRLQRLGSEVPSTEGAQQRPLKLPVESNAVRRILAGASHLNWSLIAMKVQLAVSGQYREDAILLCS